MYLTKLQAYDAGTAWTDWYVAKNPTYGSCDKIGRVITKLFPLEKTSLLLFLNPQNSPRRIFVEFVMS